MVRRAARGVLGRIRRFNRWWIDRLDPEDHHTPAPTAGAAEPVTAADPSPPTARSPVARPGRAIDLWAESTPNPNAVKFVCSVQVVDRALTWRAGDRTDHPLGRALLAIPGVASAFAVGDFVTVTRAPSGDWDTLSPAIEAAVRGALS